MPNIVSSIFQMQISVEWGFYQIPMIPDTRYQILDARYTYVDTRELVKFNSDHLHYVHYARDGTIFNIIIERQYSIIDNTESLEPSTKQ